MSSEKPVYVNKTKHLQAQLAGLKCEMQSLQVSNAPQLSHGCLIQLYSCPRELYQAKAIFSQVAAKLTTEDKIHQQHAKDGETKYSTLTKVCSYAIFSSHFSQVLRDRLRAEVPQPA